MKYNMADASQTLLMLPKAENTQCLAWAPGWLFWARSGGAAVVSVYPTALVSAGFLPLQPGLGGGVVVLQGPVASRFSYMGSFLNRNLRCKHQIENLPAEAFSVKWSSFF